MTIPLIKPDWPAPDNIQALTTTRAGGFSQPPFDELNLATHVEDELPTVIRNRDYLLSACHLPQRPYWLNQTHTTIAVDACSSVDTPNADAAYTNKKNTLCAVLTADCLPLLICDKAGTLVSAIHAGWRGLGAGIIAKTLTQLPVSPQNLLVWLGPAIGPKAFEVQQDVVDYFTAFDPDASRGFTRISPTHYLADNYQIARMQLEKLGVTAIYGGEYCTYTQKELFFSFRRDHKTGRMASLIWME